MRKADLQEYAQGIKGHLRVFASTGPITEYLPAVLRAYLPTHPDVLVDLREHLSQDIARAVSDGTTDIGIVADIVCTDGLETVPYRQYPTRFGYRGGSPARESLQSDRASLERLWIFNYVGLLEGGVMNTFLRQAASRLNRDLKIRVQVASFEALCRMVESNVGIGIMPELPARRHSKNDGNSGYQVERRLGAAQIKSVRAESAITADICQGTCRSLGCRSRRLHKSNFQIANEKSPLDRACDFQVTILLRNWKSFCFLAKHRVHWLSLDQLLCRT